MIKSSQRVTRLFTMPWVNPFMALEEVVILYEPTQCVIGEYTGNNTNN